MPVTVLASRPPRSGRPALHFLGNMLIGIAIGLIAYYGVTDLEGRIGQRSMRAQLGKLGPVAKAEPPVSESAPRFDFTDWEQQDQAFWTSAEQGSVIGRLVIERMGLDTAVLKGTKRETLKMGPGWIDTTAVPGETGNCAISGHRTTYHAPFRRLDSLAKGDTIELYTPYRRYVYRVARKFTVRPWQVDVISPTEEPMLTLTACHPPYSARYRLIVQARLVEARPIEGAVSAQTP
jgi:LPXTG-site transpeptidase (sortase) family protein